MYGMTPGSRTNLKMVYYDMSPHNRVYRHVTSKREGYGISSFSCCVRFFL